MPIYEYLCSDCHKESVILIRSEDDAKCEHCGGQNLKKKLSNTEVSPDVTGPRRYKQLADIVRFYKPSTILETGTWNGGRAVEMALAAFESKDKVHYIGFDLFGWMSRGQLFCMPML